MSEAGVVHVAEQLPGWVLLQCPQLQPCQVSLTSLSRLVRGTASVG